MSTSTLERAVAAIKAGRRTEGRALLQQILSADPRNVSALLWMTEVANGVDERRKYLNQVLVIDPGNAAAIRGLELLQPVDELPTWITQPTLPSQPQSSRLPAQVQGELAALEASYAEVLRRYEASRSAAALASIITVAGFFLYLALPLSSIGSLGALMLVTGGIWLLLSLVRYRSVQNRLRQVESHIASKKSEAANFQVGK